MSSRISQHTQSGQQQYLGAAQRGGVRLQQTDSIMFQKESTSGSLKTGGASTEQRTGGPRRTSVHYLPGGSFGNGGGGAGRRGSLDVASQIAQLQGQRRGSLSGVPKELQGGFTPTVLGGFGGGALGAARERRGGQVLDEEEEDDAAIAQLADMMDGPMTDSSEDEVRLPKDPLRSLTVLDSLL